jgi:hypothetical protein
MSLSAVLLRNDTVTSLVLGQTDSAIGTDGGATCFSIAFPPARHCPSCCGGVQSLSFSQHSFRSEIRYAYIVLGLWRSARSFRRIILTAGTYNALAWLSMGNNGVLTIRDDDCCQCSTYLPGITLRPHHWHWSVRSLSRSKCPSKRRCLKLRHGEGKYCAND